MATRIPLNKAYLEQKELERQLETSIAALGLSSKTTNCLEEEGICTIGDLLACKQEKLLKIPNFGKKTLEGLFKALEKFGFYRDEKRPQLAKSA